MVLAETDLQGDSDIEEVILLIIGQGNQPKEESEDGGNIRNGLEVETLGEWVNNLRQSWEAVFRPLL